jgi:hypothetical protein
MVEDLLTSGKSKRFKPSIEEKGHEIVKTSDSEKSSSWEKKFFDERFLSNFNK